MDQLSLSCSEILPTGGDLGSRIRNLDANAALKLRPVIGHGPTAASPPVLRPGELWLLALAAAGDDAMPWERAALTAANVIVYDRSLTDLVAAILPLGGYAEPATGDGMQRCIQFVRDGWSVIRLLDAAMIQQGLGTPLASLSHKLHAAGASDDLTVTDLIGMSDGRVTPLEMRLGEIDFPGSNDRAGQRRAVAFGAFSTNHAAAFQSVMSNGLAG
ncbi:MAG TPA: hypothetical protein VHY35_04240 [Stellaceae bacterium]|jgi:hypothetical protein|nr:hypothetical protein [Stellaceae bacterium]